MTRSKHIMVPRQVVEELGFGEELLAWLYIRTNPSRPSERALAERFGWDADRAQRLLSYYAGHGNGSRVLAARGAEAPLPGEPSEHHKGFHWLSWYIYIGRQHLYGEHERRFYDPWSPKALKLCKSILEGKARGDFDEAVRRMRVLYAKCANEAYERPGSTFWAFDPENFISKWPRLTGDPVLRVPKPGKGARKAAAYDEAIAQYRREAGSDGSQQAD